MEEFGGLYVLVNNVGWEHTAIFTEKSLPELQTEPSNAILSKESRNHCDSGPRLWWGKGVKTGYRLFSRLLFNEEVSKNGTTTISMG
ncbi:hypothetical protein DSCO28_26280 [Desulfosarcina ovata subsp. sediminis]|uniref:Uncharacterized protein n=1 Tax=Desulfosarcina ovata subsp. sediminis TaxID=885957 RepID=A0A5K7ZIV8_9BACT|nr:hypothetical protein DSCO28_26280 [Desulfosarcina ovata subsp. sediminis]